MSNSFIDKLKQTHQHTSHLGIHFIPSNSWLDENVFGEIYDNWTATCLEISTQPFLRDSFIETFVGHYTNSPEFTKEDLKLNIPLLIAQYLVKEQTIPQDLILAYVVWTARRTIDLRTPIKSATIKLDRHKRQLSIAQDRYTELEAISTEISQYKTVAQTKLQTLNTELENLSIWSRLLNSNHTELQQERTLLQQRLEELELQFTDAQFELALSESESIRLRSQVAQTQQEVQVHTVQFDTVYQGLLLPISSILQARKSEWFSLIEMGRYWRGSIEGVGHSAPMIQIQLTSALSIGKTPITQALFIAVMGHNPSEFVDLMRPVEKVSWFDALQFCNEFSRMMNLEPVYALNNNSVECNWESTGFRLPTEAEWEAAARGKANDEPLDINKYAWHSANSKSKTQRVRQRRQMSTDTYDMVGNVDEWCWDWFDKSWYGESPKVNPIGPTIGNEKVLRGGGFNTPPNRCTVFSRESESPETIKNSIGFRVISRTTTLNEHYQVIHTTYSV